MTTGNDKNQASIIAQRLPEFVQTDNPTMVAFVQAYYEWLDGQAQQGYLRTPNALDGANDIDRTLDSFVSEFKKEYLLNFPEQLATNKEGNSVDARQLMKNIKEFYRNKGTEKTYEFLFRVLYDAAIDFYYPARDILRLSDGKWIQKKSIRCSNELGNKIFDARGKIIRQRSIDGNVIASANVIDVSTQQLGSRGISELFLTNINGEFKSNTSATNNYQGIEFTDNDGVGRIEPSIYPTLSKITINNTGTNYRKGERIFLTPAANPARQNLIRYSQRFDETSYWTIGTGRSLTKTNKTSAPDGSFTAYRFVPSSTSGGEGNNYFLTSSTVRFVTNRWYTISCFVKADEYSGGYLRMREGATARLIDVRFNVLPTVSGGLYVNLGSNSGGVWTLENDSRKVVDAGNGWYRVSFTAKYTGTAINNGRIEIFGGRIASVQPAQTSTTDYGIFFWGAQLNESASYNTSHPTGYAKTEATAPIEFSTLTDTGEGAVATITEVNANGGIIKTRIDNFGAGYEVSPTANISTAFGSGASLSTTVGTLCSYPGYYSGNDGRLSTNKVMQDNHYYQNFSYVLLTEIVIDRYKDILRKLIHPAGMGMFGKVVVNRCSSDVAASDAVVGKTDTEVIGSYSPYTLNTYVDIGGLLYNGRATPYFPSLHDSVITGAAGNPNDLQLYSIGQNFLAYSNDLSSAAWGRASVTITPTDNIIAPDGTNSGAKIVVDNGVSIGNAYAFKDTTSIYFNGNDKILTVSAHVKAGNLPTSTQVALFLNTENRNSFIVFDALNGTFVTETISYTIPAGGSNPVTHELIDKGIEFVGDGWYRARVTLRLKNMPVGYKNVRVGIFPYNGGTAGLNTHFIYAWGAQLEEGSIANPLLKTLDSPVVHRSYAVTFDPKGLTGLKIWLDGRTLTGAAGATTSVWGDSSGNGYTATAYERALLPTVSPMGGLYLTGSNLTHGSVLTTRNLDINQRTIFAAFTPFPLDNPFDQVSSQQNSLVVGMLRGNAGASTTTGAATGQHYQAHSICVDYARTLIDGIPSTNPRILGYYGIGNHAGPGSLSLANPNNSDTVSSSNEIRANRFMWASNDSSRVSWSLEQPLSGVTSGNPNTLVACSVLSTTIAGITSAAGVTATTEVRKFDRKSNDDLTTNATYYRWHKMVEYTVPESGSYEFSMELKTDYSSSIANWRAVLTNNDGLVEITNRSLPTIPSYIASWTFHTMTDISTGWSPITYQVHRVVGKDLKKGDVIKVWLTPSTNSGNKPTNNGLDTTKSMYLRNFVANRIYSQGKNFLTINGNEVGSAVGILNGITAGQRLTLGFGQNFFNGVIHEVLVYDRVLTDRERQTVEAYLHHRWKNDIIRAEGHPWNLPIASLTAGIYPALPSEGGYTAHSSVLLSKIGYPFYQIANHPNLYLSDTEEPYPARIFGYQKDDFLGTGGNGTDGYWIEWENNSTENRVNWALGLSDGGATGSKIAMLRYYDSSEFKKITAEAFLDRKVGRQFDCKNEVIVEPNPPKVVLQLCPQFANGLDVIYSNGTIVFNYSIENDANMEYWITDLLEVEINDGRKLYRYRPESHTWQGKFSISGFASGVGTSSRAYTVTFRLKDYYGKSISESESTVSFLHTFSEALSDYDTLNSCV